MCANDSNDCGFRGVCFRLLPLPRNTAGHVSHTLFSDITIQLPTRSKVFVLSTVVLRRCYLKRCEYRRHLLLTRVGFLTYIRQLLTVIHQPPRTCYITSHREWISPHLLSLSDKPLPCRSTKGTPPAHTERPPCRIIISRD